MNYRKLFEPDYVKNKTITLENSRLDKIHKRAFVPYRIKLYYVELSTKIDIINSIRMINYKKGKEFEEYFNYEKLIEEHLKYEMYMDILIALGELKEYLFGDRTIVLNKLTDDDFYMNMLKHSSKISLDNFMSYEMKKIKNGDIDINAKYVINIDEYGIITPKGAISFYYEDNYYKKSFNNVHFTDEKLNTITIREIENIFIKPYVFDGYNHKTIFFHEIIFYFKDIGKEIGCDKDIVIK